MSAPIAIVNDKDEIIGSASKEDAWRNGSLHRIVRIMVDDGKGRLLLQKRAPDKDLYPNRWDHSASGHVDAGEDYETAAYRELEEEIGIRDVQLTLLGTYETRKMYEWRHLNRFNRVYTCTIDPGATFRLATREVSEVRWFTIDEIKELAHDSPDQLTDGLCQVIERFY